MLSQVENSPPDDSFLTFTEVMRLKLDAEVVTLAACMTGVGQVMQGEGVLNFARASSRPGPAASWWPCGTSRWTNPSSSTIPSTRP